MGKIEAFFTLVGIVVTLGVSGTVLIVCLGSLYEYVKNSDLRAKEKRQRELWINNEPKLRPYLRALEAASSEFPELEFIVHDIRQGINFGCWAWDDKRVIEKYAKARNKQ